LNAKFLQLKEIYHNDLPSKPKTQEEKMKEFNEVLEKIESTKSDSEKKEEEEQKQQTILKNRQREIILREKSREYSRKSYQKLKLDPERYQRWLSQCREAGKRWRAKNLANRKKITK
jgi:hypothetical protein